MGYIYTPNASWIYASPANGLIQGMHTSREHEYQNKKMKLIANTRITHPTVASQPMPVQNSELP